MSFMGVSLEQANLYEIRLTSIAGGKGKFLAIWSAFITATFAFLGTEIVGVTVGET